MDGIDGLAFAAGMARVAGTMMVFPSLRLIVVVEDGGSLVLWKVRGCRRLIGSGLDGEVPGHSVTPIRMGERANSSCWHSHT